MYQIAGWGIFILINLFFAFTFDKFSPIFSGRLFVFAGLGFIFSHLMRTVILKTNILEQQLQYQISWLIIITVVFALAVAYIDMLLTLLFDITTKRERHSSWYYNLLDNSLSSFVYLFIWNCIYFIEHYIGKNRSQEVDMLKLESLVKEQELKTIKSHINPHFIFNALNSILALIDENPGRAREAITELSNILSQQHAGREAGDGSFPKRIEDRQRLPRVRAYTF